MPKVKIDDHLRGLVRNQYLHSLYRDNGTILSWAKQMQYLTVKMQGQGHGQEQTDYHI